MKQTLQYQLSNGSWVNCEDRTEEFLSMCMRWNGPDESGTIVPWHSAVRDATRAEVEEALALGRKLRNDRDDWYSNCRYAPEPVRPQMPEMVKCSCGCTVPRSSVMNASLGTSCPECYDNMSC